MIFLANIVRAVLLWWWQWLIFMLLSLLFSLTIIFLPIWKSFRELAKLIIMPFWKKIVRDTEKWKYEKWFGLVFNIIWFPIWCIMALWYFISWILSFITIIWIPYWIVSVRLAKFIFLPIWVRVLTEDEYIWHKVNKEISKHNQISYNKSINADIEIKEKYTPKIELTEEERAILEQETKDLDLLRKKQALETLKRQKEFDEKIDKLKIKIKDNFYKFLELVKNLFYKYKPIVINKSSKLANDVNKKIKETDFKEIKNKSLNSIKEKRNISINKKYIYFPLILLLAILLIFLWYKWYNYYLFNNQVIKTDENNIFLRKEPNFIEFYNNNKIQIVPEDETHTLSQILYAYRYYEEDYWNSWYKYAWYNVFNSEKEPEFMRTESDINEFNINSKNIWGNNYLEIRSEKEENINIYETKLFIELNEFTNKNTFYSNIETWKEFSGNFNQKLLNIFWLWEIIDGLEYWFSSNKKILWLDYKNNNLVLRIKYQNTTNKLEDTNIKNYLEWLENSISENKPIIFKDYKIIENENSIYIKVVFKLNYDKIKNNDSINNLPLFYKY